MVSAVVIGSNGMLGRAICEELKSTNISYRVVNRPEVELSDAASVKRAVGDDVEWVINCAAWTAVDAAEEAEEEATAINGTAVGFLADACKEIDATLVHFSTDYVFDGVATSPYPIDAPHGPINAYGRGKAKGEQLLMSSGAKFLMVRTSWLYASWGNNFVRTMMRLFAERKKLRVVDDQVGRPSSAFNVASSTCKLMQMNQLGTFHITDRGQCTWHGLTTEIARLVNPECRVESCSSEGFPRSAPRPRYSVLDLSVTEELLGPMPVWQEQVAEVIKVCSDA